MGFFKSTKLNKLDEARNNLSKAIEEGDPIKIDNAIREAQQTKNEIAVSLEEENIMPKKTTKTQELEVKEIRIKEAETSPPTRYNSGNLVLAMENAGKLIEDEQLREQIKGAGIGTSATRGEIIKKLEKIKHININSKTQIVTPTEKGEAIYDIVKQSIPDMLNPKLTASWEKGLEMVANKEIEPEEFMKKLEKYIKTRFERFIYK